MYAFVQRPFAERIGGPVNKLLHVANLGKKPFISGAKQRRALLELSKLPYAFLGKLEYPSAGIIVIGSMLYQTQADKLGHLLHD